MGFAVQKDHRDKFSIWTEGSWLDVRKPNSPLMYHWLELGATVTAKKQRITIDTFAIIGVPWPMGLQLTLPKEKYLEYRSTPRFTEHFNEMLYNVPANGPSIFWSTLTGAMGAECTTINSWRWHQHGRSMLKDMWLFRESAVNLGLPQMMGIKQVNVEVYTGMFMSGPPGSGLNVAPRNLTLEMVKERVMASGKYVCQFPLRHPDKWQTVGEDSFWPGVRAKEYPRHVIKTCPQITMYPGDSLTIVSFYDPPNNPGAGIDIPYSGLMTGQHGMLEAFQMNGVCDREVLAKRAEQGLVEKLGEGEEWFHEF